MLGISGWKIKGDLPDLRKLVIVVAPHTSNWDFYYGIAAALALGIKVHWIGKHSLFRWPIAGLLKWLGGLPVDRALSRGLVEQMAEIFEKNDAYLLGVAPEGTRKKVTKWKTGFYYIANRARVPIVLVYLDYARREIGIGPLLMPTGEPERELAQIARFYETVRARRPENFALPRRADF